MWDEIIDWIDSVQDKLNNLPERAADFADSAGETVGSIAKQVEERAFVTKRQMEAVANIEDGANRWINK